MEDGDPSGSNMHAFDFEDVTDLFERAAAAMQPNEVFLMDDFCLQDAMSALEIGEPRLDTGAIVPAQPPDQISFHPLRPLLPEEVCWILDQAMAYEMEFHAGNVLSHTVFTLLYVHHLEGISPEIVMKWHSSFEYDHRRPLVLITVVLRTAVQALLKCIDLSWRQLAKGGMYEAEDWQSDKCEVNILESTPESFIIKRLESAVRLISESPYIPEKWKSALISRILLRKNILQVLSTDIIKSRNEFLQLVFQARSHLEAIKFTRFPTPTPSSIASLAFDPYIGRKLQMTTPIRVVTLPPFQDTLSAVGRFLDDLYDLTILTSSDRLTTWQTMTDLHLWLPNSYVRMPYVRSLGQTSFYDGVLILKQHTTGWVVNQFFFETCGKTFDFLRTAILERWKGEFPAQIAKLERTVHMLMTPHIQALFSNSPRRRRYFMKHVIEWHKLYEMLVEFKSNIDLHTLPRCDILAHLPEIPLLWRFTIVREIVLSGFQLELYLGEEIPFAYWYSAEVIDEHLKYLDNILVTVVQGSETYKEMRFQLKFLTLLQSLCTALFLATISMASLDDENPNFIRRYKWAFDPEYATSFELSPPGQPDIRQYLQVCDEVMRHVSGQEIGSEGEDVQGDTLVEDGFDFQYPAECIFVAKSMGEELLRSHDNGSWAGVWAKERAELIQLLCNVCTDLSGLPQNRQELDVFDSRSKLKWDPVYNAWFPRFLT